MSERKESKEDRGMRQEFFWQGVRRVVPNPSNLDGLPFSGLPSTLLIRCTWWCAHDQVRTGGSDVPRKKRGASGAHDWNQAPNVPRPVLLVSLLI